MSFSRLMRGAKVPITSASIIETIKTSPAVPMPTIKGAMAKCDGKAVPGIPAACTAGFVFGPLDGGGKPISFTSNQ
jgi:branched-chain amino acid transport system substrate-binding protein